MHSLALGTFAFFSFASKTAHDSRLVSVAPKRRFADKKSEGS